MSEKEIFDQDLNEEELQEVTGGGAAKGEGNCSGQYYHGACVSEVTEGSDCLYNDYCDHLSATYWCPTTVDPTVCCVMIDVDCHGIPR